MGILDQLEQDDPQVGTIEVQQITSKHWVVASAALAAHQAMQDAMKYAGPAQFDLERPEFGTPGRINVEKSLKMARSYGSVIRGEQEQDLRYRPTADDVLDGGMKNGSKVLIRIVPEQKSVDDASWDDMTRVKLEGSDGKPKNLVFDKFSVVNISEPDEERYQIVETMGADFVYGFGRRPRIIVISGQVLNGKMDVNIRGETRSMDWKNAFQRRYQKHYRLTKCIHNRQKIHIVAQDTHYTGYLLNMVTNTSAADQSASQVTISFVLEDWSWPRDNDDKIPGFLNERGYAITNKTTPLDAFPQAAMEDYYYKNFIEDIDINIDALKLELEITAERIIQIDGNPSFSTDEVIDMIKETQEFVDELNGGRPNFSDILGIKVNDMITFNGLDTATLIGSLEEAVRALDVAKSLYREDANIPEDEEVRLVKGLEDSFNEIKYKEQVYRAEIKFVENTVSKLNQEIADGIIASRNLTEFEKTRSQLPSNK